MANEPPSDPTPDNLNDRDRIMFAAMRDPVPSNPFTRIRQQLEDIELELNEFDDHRQLVDRTTEDLSAQVEDSRQQVDELWGMVHGLLDAQTRIVTELERITARPAVWG